MKTAQDIIRKHQLIDYGNTQFNFALLIAMEEYASQFRVEVIEMEIRTYFANHSNCYADNSDDLVIPAMTFTGVLDVCNWMRNRVKGGK
jgi:hypothetical protein